MDQSNTLRETLDAGDAAFGARAATFSPNVVELYGTIGLDFVWLDFEHSGPSPYDSNLFEDLTRAAEIGGTELFVRLPSGHPPLIRKVLDAGVRNILIPRVDSAAEVREAVEAARFVYDGAPGERGKASGRAATWGNADDYVATEDREVNLGVMIEKTTAVDELANIVDVPELGFLFIGPSDLSVQMGHSENKSHPDVQGQVDEIRNVALDAGVPVGCIGNDPAAAAEAVEEGYQIIRMGGELSAAQSVLSERLEAIRDY